MAKKQKRAKNSDQVISPGITLSKKNEATVDPELHDLLFSLAEKLESETDLPVDVQHVLAAIVMLSKQGELDPAKKLTVDDSSLISRLKHLVHVLFDTYGGEVENKD